MRSDDMLFWTRAAPFRPFRVFLNSGRSYEIRHPELLRIGRTSMIFFSVRGGPDDPYDRAEMVSLVLIERIEPIETPAAA